jgi:hypothetical protein
VSTVTYPGTLTDASVNSGATLMTYLNVIKTLIETTKLDRDSLQFPKADCPIVVTDSRATIANGTYNYYVKIPASLSAAFEPVSLQVVHDVESGADTVCTLNVRAGIGGTAISSAAATSAADSLVEVTTFTTSSIAAGTILHFELVTSGANTPSYVTMTLWGKTSHRT